MKKLATICIISLLMSHTFLSMKSYTNKYNEAYYQSAKKLGEIAHNLNPDARTGFGFALAPGIALLSESWIEAKNNAENPSRDNVAFSLGLVSGCLTIDALLWIIANKIGTPDGLGTATVEAILRNSIAIFLKMGASVDLISKLALAIRLNIKTNPEA